MNDIKIGTILSDLTPDRDAIHIAVAAVVASEELKPGFHVGLDAMGRATTRGKARTVGVVDPFLRATVREGERFWLFLYPGSITSLRHDWTHPAFVKPVRTIDRDTAIAWLQRYADRLGVTLEELVAGVQDDGCISTDINYPSDVPDEFWEHYAAFIGRDVNPSDRFEYFRCAC